MFALVSNSTGLIAIATGWSRLPLALMVASWQVARSTGGLMFGSYPDRVLPGREYLNIS